MGSGVALNDAGDSVTNASATAQIGAIRVRGAGVVLTGTTIQSSIGLGSASSNWTIVHPTA